MRGAPARVRRVAAPSSSTSRTSTASSPACPAPTRRPAGRCSSGASSDQPAGCVALRPLADGDLRDEAALRPPRARGPGSGNAWRPASSRRRAGSGTPGCGSTRRREWRPRRLSTHGSASSRSAPVHAQPGARHALPRARALRGRHESSRSPRPPGERPERRVELDRTPQDARPRRHAGRTATRNRRGCRASSVPRTATERRSQSVRRTSAGHRARRTRAQRRCASQAGPEIDETAQLDDRLGMVLDPQVADAVDPFARFAARADALDDDRGRLLAALSPPAACPASSAATSRSTSVPTVCFVRARHLVDDGRAREDVPLHGEAGPDAVARPVQALRAGERRGTAVRRDDPELARLARRVVREHALERLLRSERRDRAPRARSGSEHSDTGGLRRDRSAPARAHGTTEPTEK